MHDPYDEDDGYDDEYYDHDYNDQYDPYKFYFKFDVNPNTPLSDWITKMINDIFQNPSHDNFKITNIPGFPVVSFPVNSWNPNTVNDKKFQYLGSNYAGEQVWKAKYFVHDKLQIEYINHLRSHVTYFVKQPSYYRCLFEILN